MDRGHKLRVILFRNFGPISPLLDSALKYKNARMRLIKVRVNILEGKKKEKPPPRLPQRKKNHNQIHPE